MLLLHSVYLLVSVAWGGIVGFCVITALNNIIFLSSTSLNTLFVQVHCSLVLGETTSKILTNIDFDKFWQI